MKNLASVLTKSLSEIFSGALNNNTAKKNRPPITATPMIVKTLPEQKLAHNSHKQRYTPDIKEVQNRAYQIWQRNGRRHGNDQKDWYDAEQELLAIK